MQPAERVCYAPAVSRAGGGASVNELAADLARWELNSRAVRQQMYGAPSARERERWHALWLPNLGWTAAGVAEVLERDAHTEGSLAGRFSPRWAKQPIIRAERRFPPALNQEQRAALKAAVQAPPSAAGVEVANWNWKTVRAFVERRFGLRLRRSSCLRSLHRLGFVLKRPKKHLFKADAAEREVFVRDYGALRREAAAIRAKIFFVDEAHFYADVDLHAKWVLKREPTLVDSASPRWGEKASYYSAVCLETGDVEAMSLEGNSDAETSSAFLKQLRAKHHGTLFIIWDNGPAHGGDALRAYLGTPGLGLRLVQLPAYSPDYNADEAVWRWIREEVTANTCFGTKAKVREHVDASFHGSAQRVDEVISRCRTVLQASAEALVQSQPTCNVDPIAA